MTDLQTKSATTAAGPPDLEALRAGLHLPPPGPDVRIVVAMSGGVDSSVTAALLHEFGYDVVGLTLQLYDYGAAVKRVGACCAGQDIRDAARVCERIGVPHYVLDYEKRFLDKVMNHFADSYLAGETPVPCVMCNQDIKFHHMLDTARELGATAMATGHYIQSRPTADGWGLYQAADDGRDQSYFLFSTPRRHLDFLRFPLGGLKKSATRALAEKYGLAVADKPDSQDICFVPQGRYADVIEKLRPGAAEPGDILHVDGRVLGRHQGVIHYTIGQRRGLGVSVGEPLFVTALDVENHQVIVGPREALKRQRITLRGVNWLGSDELADLPADGLEILAQIRSTRPPAPARLLANGDQPAVELLEADFGVSPGQACVFYDANDPDGARRILGGGWIVGAG